MSPGMAPMEIGVLFVQFSAIPDSARTEFLRQHPEIRNAAVVDWALTAARLRGQMGEPEASSRLARAALYIATELGDPEREAQAQELLAERLVQDRDDKLLSQRNITHAASAQPQAQTISPSGDAQSIASPSLSQHTKAPTRPATELAAQSSAINQAFTSEVFDLLAAVATAGSEAAARRVVRSQMQLVLHNEFLPALLQIQDLYRQAPNPPPNLEAFCALMLDEVVQMLAALEPEIAGIGGACTALMLADSSEAIQTAIARYQPLFDQAFFAEWTRMGESFAARGLFRLATLTNMLADIIRQHINPVDRQALPTDADAQTLALVQKQASYSVTASLGSDWQRK